MQARVSEILKIENNKIMKDKEQELEDSFNNNINSELEQEFDKACEIAILDYLGVMPNERILVLADNSKREIGLKLYEVALRLGFEAFYIEMKEAKYNGQEPDLAIAEMMTKFDVVICPTRRSLTHTDARRNACKNGARVATLPGITKEIFVRCLNAESDVIVDLSSRLKDRFEGVESIRVVTELGTDITMSIKGRNAISSTGIIRTKGSGGNLPSGEVYLAPMEGTSNGVIVFDGSVASVGILDENMTIIVKDGYAVEINGNHQADLLRQMLTDIGDDAFAIAELGIGTNHKAIISGLILEDEKVLGTAHIAFGNNKGMGGVIDVPIHIDGIIKSPDIYFDDYLIMKKGEFVF